MSRHASRTRTEKIANPEPAVGRTWSSILDLHVVHYIPGSQGYEAWLLLSPIGLRICFGVPIRLITALPLSDVKFSAPRGISIVYWT